TAGWFAAFPLLAVVAVTWLAQRRAMRCDAGFLTAAAALLLALAMTLATVKGAPYAMSFAMPPVAALALRLFEAGRMTSVLARFAVLMLLTPTAVTAAAVGIAAAMGHESPTQRARAGQQACFATENYAALAALPPGLVAAN